jgi:hypothetical protein
LLTCEGIDSATLNTLFSVTQTSISLEYGTLHIGYTIGFTVAATLTTLKDITTLKNINIQMQYQYQPGVTPYFPKSAVKSFVYQPVAGIAISSLSHAEIYYSEDPSKNSTSINATYYGMTTFADIKIQYSPNGTDT